MRCTGWPRVQSNILTSCFSAAASQISTKFELGKAHMLTFCRLNFQVIRFSGSQLIHIKLNHKKSVHAGFQQFSLVWINCELLNRMTWNFNLQNVSIEVVPSSNLTLIRLAAAENHLVKVLDWTLGHLEFLTNFTSWKFGIPYFVSFRVYEAAVPSHKVASHWPSWGCQITKIGWVVVEEEPFTWYTKSGPLLIFSYKYYFE